MIKTKKSDIKPLKPDIETEKPDIEPSKPDIEQNLMSKTFHYIQKIQEEFPSPSIFGRSDIMKVIDIKASRTSELIKQMLEYGVIEPVSGYGKGKYRVKQNRLR